MTTFSFPVNIDNREPASGSVVDLTSARVPGRFSVVVNTAKTGTAVCGSGWFQLL